MSEGTSYRSESRATLRTCFTGGVTFSPLVRGAGAFGVFGLLLFGCSSGNVEGRSSPDSARQETTTPVESAPAETATATTDAAPSAGGASSIDASEALFPDVVDATATSEGNGRWKISATLSSPYDSPDRYADAWRVVGPDGTVYGERVLTHDHASEQPFTRSQDGIALPAEVSTVTIEGRDQVNGWGGQTFKLDLPA